MTKRPTMSVRIPPTPIRRSADAAGFTLLEILVALVVLGLLIATVTQGIRVGLLAGERVTRWQSDTADLETTTRVLRRLIADLLPAPPSGQDTAFVGTPHAASFVTILPDGFAAAPTREADVSLGVDGGRHLVLRWRPHYRRWIVPPPVPATKALLNGVARLDLSFWQPGQGAGGGVWASNWSAPDPPPLVKFRVVFPPGDARHWPDIIAAPMQATPNP
jgi:general secretion pathway protein J